ncbi:MAG TPA: tripartite tricarboxylate transporter substrate-binding protein [Methylibium sp.]|uniref:Bug family tripartite tricarboxylate transporter substrate binding protein n=1 Tax=Methylibium sp. TaxID=2067992 RepID=UPI002DB6BB54|nr:tripartite tricarboxylate transporter substrate-binding protein [Methylibium sp.]HEU4458175.1 tripartite tricarboxylate transporter substrate-binding protein [Methylibium sp.]
MTEVPSRGRRAALCRLMAAPAALAVPSWAAAQAAWPSKPVTLIVPFPAGGGTDAFARPLSAALTRQFGKQVLVDNRGGAGGTVGAGIAAKSAPDGYSWFLGAVHHAIAPSVYPKLDYDIRSDLVPVALVSKVPQVVVVNPQRVPAANLPELLKFVRANPGKLNYGSAGNGTSHHLAGELFKLQTKTFITHIPYRGAGPALQDLIAGQVDVMFDGLGSSAVHIKNGRIKALAVAAEQRSPGFPDIPTAGEGGVPTYQVATWYGLWAPRGTPKELIERMAGEVTRTIGGELKDTWVQLGSKPAALTGAAFGNFVEAEIKRWAEVVKASGAKLD